MASAQHAVRGGGQIGAGRSGDFEQVGIDLQEPRQSIEGRGQFAQAGGQRQLDLILGPVGGLHVGQPGQVERPVVAQGARRCQGSQACQPIAAFDPLIGRLLVRQRDGENVGIRLINSDSTQ